MPDQDKIRRTSSEVRRIYYSHHQPDGDPETSSPELLYVPTGGSVDPWVLIIYFFFNTGSPVLLSATI